MALGDGIRPALDRRFRNAAARVRRLAARTRRDMQATAPWTDRTGNARRSLDATVDMSRRVRRATITLTLGYHGAPTVSYGVYLEKKHGGNWAIVDPTAARVTPQFRAAVIGGMAR